MDGFPKMINTPLSNKLKVISGILASCIGYPVSQLLEWRDTDSLSDVADFFSNLLLDERQLTDPIVEIMGMPQKMLLFTGYHIPAQIRTATGDDFLILFELFIGASNRADTILGDPPRDRWRKLHLCLYHPITGTCFPSKTGGFFRIGKRVRHRALLVGNHQSEEEEHHAEFVLKNIGYAFIKEKVSRRIANTTDPNFHFGQVWAIKLHGDTALGMANPHEELPY